MNQNEINEDRLNDAGWVLLEEVGKHQSITGRLHNNIKGCLRRAVECYLKEDNEQDQTINNYNSDVKVSLKGDTLSVEKIVEAINHREEEFKNGDVVYCREKPEEYMFCSVDPSKEWVSVIKCKAKGGLYTTPTKHLSKTPPIDPREEMAKRIYEAYLKCIPFPAPTNAEWNDFIHQDIYLKMVDKGVVIND